MLVATALVPSTAAAEGMLPNRPSHSTGWIPRTRQHFLGPDIDAIEWMAATIFRRTPVEITG
jgi:hypothetical protein